MTCRIAVVQPISHRAGMDENNVAEAVATVATRDDAIHPRPLREAAE